MDTNDFRLNLRSTGIVILILGAILWLWSAFAAPGQEFDIFRSSSSTKTAIALTSDALLGPFPTSTEPTYTPTDLATITPTLPTATPSATRTPTPTFSFQTATQRTSEPGSSLTGVPIGSPTLRPTSTRLNPTIPPSGPTNTSAPPTNIPPTQRPPTQRPPTQQPPTQQPPTQPPPLPPIVIPTIVIPPLPPIVLPTIDLPFP